MSRAVDFFQFFKSCLSPIMYCIITGTFFDWRLFLKGEYDNLKFLGYID